MRILGIDYGDKNLGLAVSDPLNITAQSLGRYQRKGRRVDSTHFKELAARYDIGRIVVGLPLRMDGTEGSRVEKTKKFAAWLIGVLVVPLVFWDERLTTRQALRILREQKMSHRRKKGLKDPIAAVLILQAYLETERYKSHVEPHS